MKFIKVSVLLFAVFVFSSCVGRGVDQSKLPQPQSDFAINYMERIRAGDYDAAISMTSENVREQLTPQLFSQMSSLFPTGTVYCEVIGMTKDLKYKVIFLLTMFIGVGFVTINWTSGEMSALKFFITIPQLYARSASPYSPWQIGFGVPVSALIFWFTRGSLKKKSD